MGLQAALILVKCRNVIGRKSPNNSESLLSFYLCFFLLNVFSPVSPGQLHSFKAISQRRVSQSGDPVTLHCPLAMGFSETKMSSQSRQEGMIHSWFQVSLLDKKSSGVSWQEVQLLAQLPSPPCFSFLTLHPFIEAGKKNLMCCSFFAIQFGLQFKLRSSVKEGWLFSLETSS